MSPSISPHNSQLAKLSSFNRRGIDYLPLASILPGSRPRRTDHVQARPARVRRNLGRGRQRVALQVVTMGEFLELNYTQTGGQRAGRLGERQEGHVRPRNGDLFTSHSLGDRTYRALPDLLERKDVKPDRISMYCAAALR